MRNVFIQSFNTRSIFIGTLFLVCFPTPIESSNILVITPSTYSHVHYFVAISEKLIGNGHNVYAVMNGDCHVAIKSMESVGIKVLPYYVKDKFCFTEARSGGWGMGLFKSEDSRQDNHDFLTMLSTEALKNTAEMFDDDYVAKLKEINLDLAIVDGCRSTWYTYIIPYKLDLPYVTFTTMYFPLIMGLPALTSFSTNALNTFPEKMSFFERLKNTIDTYQVNRLAMNLDGSKDELVAKFAPEKPQITIIQLLRRSAVWLLNTDIVLDYPRVTLPHVINVGGVTAKPGKTLPDFIQGIIDDAENGFILFSYGSLINQLPVAVINKIMAALGEVTEVKIIMKYSGPTLNNVPSHIKVLKWIPQNDILAHPSIRLFITHCGNNGQLEAVHHGVPMLGMPIFSDQPYNANRMAVKGYGLVLNAQKFTAEDMASKIKEMLNNSTYRENIQKASKIFHSRPETPAERVAYWVEHVIEHGGDYMMSEALTLPWYQYWLVDVAAFLAGIATLCVIFLGIIIVIFYRLIHKGVKKYKIH